MRNVVKNICLLLIDNAIALHAVLRLNTEIMLRDAKIIIIVIITIEDIIKQDLTIIDIKLVWVVVEFILSMLSTEKVIVLYVSVLA